MCVHKIPTIVSKTLKENIAFGIIEKKNQNKCCANYSKNQLIPTKKYEFCPTDMKARFIQDPRDSRLVITKAYTTTNDTNTSYEAIFEKHCIPGFGRARQAE